MNNDIIVIADVQADNTTPTAHLDALSKYIWEHKPEKLVHIGDHWDYPSLSTYNSELDAEGMRLNDDLEGGNRALKCIMAYTDTMNKRGKQKVYRPDKLFCKGNHENRLTRFLAKHPRLEGCFDINSFLNSEGWEVYDFCKPLWINDVCFVHYLENAMSGRAVGGSIENKLNKFPHSFVHGHQQQFQYGRRQNYLGKPHMGVCAGSFYLHDEGYRGANNTEIRGFPHMRAFINRYGFLDYDVEFVSIERLIRDYG